MYRILDDDKEVHEQRRCNTRAAGKRERESGRSVSQLKSLTLQPAGHASRDVREPPQYCIAQDPQRLSQRPLRCAPSQDLGVISHHLRKPCRAINGGRVSDSRTPLCSDGPTRESREVREMSEAQANDRRQACVRLKRSWTPALFGSRDCFRAGLVRRCGRACGDISREQ